MCYIPINKIAPPHIIRCVSRRFHACCLRIRTHIKSQNKLNWTCIENSHAICIYIYFGKASVGSSNYIYICSLRAQRVREMFSWKMFSMLERAYAFVNAHKQHARIVLLPPTDRGKQSRKIAKVLNLRIFFCHGELYTKTQTYLLLA